MYFRPVDISLEFDPIPYSGPRVSILTKHNSLTKYVQLPSIYPLHPMRLDSDRCIHITSLYLFITFTMLLIAVATVYYSPLTHISHMIFHKPSFHFHVTVGIATSDNIVSTDLKVSLKRRGEKLNSY